MPIKWPPHKMLMAPSQETFFIRMPLWQIASGWLSRHSLLNGQRTEQLVAVRRTEHCASRLLEVREAGWTYFKKENSSWENHACFATNHYLASTASQLRSSTPPTCMSSQSLLAICIYLEHCGCHRGLLTTTVDSGLNVNLEHLRVMLPRAHMHSRDKVIPLGTYMRICIYALRARLYVHIP